jgi:DNA-binding transcriptional LysR family regulator
MIDLDRLRSLHAVATHGSLQAAAEALHVSPSAVSQQIAKLEREIGEPLLARRGRGVALTDAADLLTRHAERALSVLRQAEAELDARRREVSGTVSIAAFATAVRGLGPEALRRLAAAHPKLEVELHELEPVPAIPRLVRGDFDLVVAQDWVNAPLPIPEGLERAPLLDDAADIALPKSHRAVAGAGTRKRRKVPLAELAGESWIASEPGSICHDWLLNTLRGLGREPSIRHTAVEFATHLAMVGAGLGATVLPRLGRGPIPDDVRLVAVEPALVRHIYALWRGDTTRRTAVKAAVDAFAAAGRGAGKRH